MNKVEQAVELFRNGFNCSQAVVGSYCEQFGLDRETAFKVAAVFGGGMNMGETCGAVTGALMVIGLKYGNNAEKVVEYIGRFKARNGSVVCKELLGYDISKPDEMKKAQAAGACASVCPKMVRQASLIIEEILAED